MQHSYKQHTVLLPVLIACVLGLLTNRPEVCVASEVPAADVQDTAMRQSEFVAFDANYLQHKSQRIARARALGKQVRDRESAGQSTLASNQILYELSWMIDSTADFGRIDQRLADLADSLSHPERESLASQQDAADGSWGRYATEWFMKVDLSFDHLMEKQLPQARISPPRILDRINSSDKLTDYFMSVSISDIAKSGVDHRRELNESLANLTRLILRNKPDGYPYDPALKKTMLDLIQHRLRNPATGCWGEQYVRGGHVQFVDSLSITFHMISYLHGEVSDLPKVVDFLLATRTLEEPVGWLHDGKYTNHNNMDVVTLFKLGWPQSTESQRHDMTAEMQKMLDWCLHDSLQADGSFKLTTESREEEEYFAVEFLVRAGYFDPSQCFWSAQKFPESSEIRQRLIAYIKDRQDRGRAGVGWYEDALAALVSGNP